MKKSLENYDWENWIALEHATLLFIVRAGRILLIRKKRGLGAGKINGPGGKLDPGETPLQCAVREVQEEVGVTPTKVRAMGEIRFQFENGLTIWGYIFRADGMTGAPVETDEAIPHWFDVGQLPFDQMWPDDEIWLPWLLAGRRFQGRVLVGEEEQMLDHDLRTIDDTRRWAWE